MQGGGLNIRGGTVALDSCNIYGNTLTASSVSDKSEHCSQRPDVKFGLKKTALAILLRDSVLEEGWTYEAEQ